MLLNSFGNALSEDILNLEKRFHTTFPNKYRLFLEQFNGGIVDKNDDNQFYIEEISKWITIDVLYGINTGNASSDITTWMTKLEEDLVDRAIIIGDDLMQGMIVLIPDGNLSGIYYWDDEYHFEESSDDSNTYKLVDNIDSFFNKLKIKI